MQRLTKNFVAQLSAVLLFGGVCAAAGTVEVENASSIDLGAASAEDGPRVTTKSNARRNILHPDYNVASAPLPEPISACEASDFDDDSVIGFSDLMHVLEQWDQPKAGGGEIGFAELLNVLTQWGSCS